MKFAICFSGQPRINEQVHVNHLSSFLNKNMMVFMHGWWLPEHAGKTIMFHSTERFPEKDMGKLISDSYHFNDCLFEDYKDFDLSFCKSHNYKTWKNVTQKYLDIFTPSILYACLSQAYSNLQSVQLSLGYSPDVIVRTRLDVVLTKDLSLSLKNLSFKDDEIYIQSSMEGGHKYCGEFPNNPCDWFYCGSSQAMEKYAKSVFDIIYEECSTGVRHVRELAVLAAKRAGLKLVLYDFGALVFRQLIQNPHFRPHTFYLEEFDDNSLRITHNHDMWPLYHGKIDFQFLRKQER